MMLSRLAAACAGLAVDHPRLVLAASVLVTVGFFFPASRVRYDASTEGWFLKNDPAVAAYHDFKSWFGSDEFLLAVLEAGGGSIFENDYLRSLESVTDELNRVDHVTRIHSLSTLNLVKVDGNDLAASPAVPPLPLSSTELERVRRTVLADPVAVRSVVHPRGNLAMILIEFDPGPDAIQTRLSMVGEVREVLRAERDAAGLEYRLVGDAVLHERLVDGIHRFLTRNVPATVLMIAAVLWILFRGRGTILALLVVLSALTVTRGIQGLLGWGDNSLLILYPIVVLVTGVADSVHLLDRYFVHRGGGGGARSGGSETVRQTVGELFQPCLVTTVTTIIGFLAVSASPLFPLRQLGVLSAIGVGAAFLFSVLALPAALCLLQPVAPAAGGRRVLSGLLARLPSAIAGRRRAILSGAVALTVLGFVGLTRLQVESSYLESFRSDDPVRVSAEWVEERGGGLAGLEVVISCEEEGGLLRGEVLSAMEGMAGVLEEQSVITGAYSMVEVLKTLNQWMHEGDPEAYRLPQSRDLAAQYLLLHEVLLEDDMGGFVNLPRTRGRIWARAQFGTSSEYDAMAEATERYASDAFPPDISVQFTGLVFLFKNMHDYIVASQIRSFALALVLVTICLGLVFGSLRLASLSLIPNVWPIVLVLGFMGWVGWWLQPASAMVAAVALGIAVDDTVHFLNGYLEARRSGASPAEATARMIDRAGRAVTATTIILVLGFGLAIVSPLKDAAVFGSLCMLALSLALIGDLIILPALLGGRSSRNSLPHATP